jgi:hypothetical protein
VNRLLAVREPASSVYVVSWGNVARPHLTAGTPERLDSDLWSSDPLLRRKPLFLVRPKRHAIPAEPGSDTDATAAHDVGRGHWSPS